MDKVTREPRDERPVREWADIDTLVRELALKFPHWWVNRVTYKHPIARYEIEWILGPGLHQVTINDLSCLPILNRWMREAQERYKYPDA